MTFIIILCILLLVALCIQTARAIHWRHEAWAQTTRVEEYGDCLVRLRERYYDERREAQRLRHIAGEKIVDAIRERIDQHARID